MTHHPPIDGPRASAFFAVVGDVHAELPLAAQALGAVEEKLGAPLAQVFCVGDLGLFLSEADWRWMTGPKRHRHPERSAAIAHAWEGWRWPLSTIGGNHEPYGPLRAWEPARFGARLGYTDAGELPHVLPGLRVYGLSGIHHPGHLGWQPPGSSPKKLRAAGWPDLVGAVERQLANPKELTYYRQADLDRLSSLPPRPHLLLTHDWPVWPEGIRPPFPEFADKPEGRLLERLCPIFHLCGHHHRPWTGTVGATQVRALALLEEPAAVCGQATSGEVTVSPHADEGRHPVQPGWAALFEWTPARDDDPGILCEKGFWPPLGADP